MTPPPPRPTKAPTVLVAVPVMPAKPLGSQRANTGPGTQTEDDIYVGVKRQVQGVNTPGTATPQVRPGLRHRSTAGLPSAAAPAWNKPSGC